EWQLRVAAGEALPKSQEAITLSGHAFEARLYAEDPQRDFLPATGTLHHLAFPAQEDGRLRIETGVRAGDDISPFYDPMIAKLVVHGQDRPAALTRLEDALAHTQIAGTVVNLAFLAALARDDDFAAGRVDTGLIARRQAGLTAATAPAPRIVAQAALTAAGLATQKASADPWDTLRGYGHFSSLAHD